MIESAMRMTRMENVERRHPDHSYFLPASGTLWHFTQSLKSFPRDLWSNLGGFAVLSAAGYATSAAPTEKIPATIAEASTGYILMEGSLQGFLSLSYHIETLRVLT